MANHTPSALPSSMTEKIRRTDADCWEWQGSTQGNGYGKMMLNGRNWLTHRASYTLLVGPIPDGLVIDHLCRNRSCCNPDHLRAVTQRENTLAPGSLSPSAINASKSECPLGHPLTAKGAARRCRTCDIARDRQRWPERSKLRSEFNRERRSMSSDDRDALLVDVLALFGGVDRLKTSDIIAGLIDSQRWTPHLAPLTDRQRSYWLARALGQSPRTHRIDGRAAKGYHLLDLTGQGRGRVAA